MESSNDYDALLRSIFDSCDSTGSGFISATDFEELCSQLSLQAEYSMLFEYLFRSKSRISYDSFREGLLQLLSGTLASNACESGTDGESQLDVDLVHHRHGDSYVTRNNSLKKEVDRESSSNKSEEDESQDSLKSNEWLPMDNMLKEENFKRKRTEDGCCELPKSDNSTEELSHIRNRRRYGRRTSTEHVLERSDGRHLRSSLTHKLSNQSNLKMAGDNAPAHERSLFASVTIGEELVGDGDGTHWSTPDHDHFQTQDTVSDDYVVIDHSAVSDAQEALGAIWLQAIGDLDSSINIDQLQELYHALSLTSSGGDVKQLFEILDTDGDGLIGFNDFARQMSAFLNPNNNEETEIETQAHVLKAGFTSRGRSFTKEATPELKHPNSHFPSSPCCASPSARRALVEDFSLDTAGERFQQDQPAMMQPSSFSTEEQASSAKLPPDNSGFHGSFPANEGRLISNGLDTFEINSYEGAPKYRRRRKSNPKLTRSRRRNIRSAALPLHHPISRRRAEESPMFFLTEENGRYVDIEKLQAVWWEEGIEDTEQILKDLGITCAANDSFSAEVLAEAMEAEMKDNSLHHAIFSVYKSGIAHYRSQKEQEQCERQKLQNLVDHLTSQLREQDEKVEKMECDYQSRMEEVKRYKSQVAKLNQDLMSVQRKFDNQDEQEVIGLKKRVKELSEVENLLRKELKERLDEFHQLEQQHAAVVTLLQISESDIDQMRSDFELVCEKMVACKREQQKQDKRMEELLLQYQETASKNRDETDELFNDLDRVKRKWWSQSARSVSPYHTAVSNARGFAEATRSAGAPSQNSGNTATSSFRLSSFAPSSLAADEPKRNCFALNCSDLRKKSADPDTLINDVAQVEQTNTSLAGKSLHSELMSFPGVT